MLDTLQLTDHNTKRGLC